MQKGSLQLPLSVALNASERWASLVLAPWQGAASADYPLESQPASLPCAPQVAKRRTHSITVRL